MYPSIFNRFPVIQPVSSKVRHFSTFLAHFGLPWVRPWDNHGKHYMDGKRIQCWSNRPTLQHIPIYLQPFTSYSKILVIAAAWTRSNRLQLNPDKTEVLWCATSRRQHQLPTADMLIECKLTPVTRSPSICFALC